MDDETTTLERRRDHVDRRRRRREPVTADADGDDTDTTDGDADDSDADDSTRTTRTPDDVLAPALDARSTPVGQRALPRGALGATSRSSSRAERRGASTTSSPCGTSSGCSPRRRSARPGFRLVKAGATVAGYTTDLSWRPEPFTGVADVRRVLAEFEGGATIVLQGLHHSWLPLARYCRQLEAFLGQPAQANAYFTPRGSQGLPVHHDTHEVLSLQVAGEKRWLVYEPVLELPLKNQRYRSALGAPGEPVLDVTLRAGDTLYLPRGWLHQALTSDSDSLHITVGVNVRTWLDEARAALDALRATTLDFRRDVDGDEPPSSLRSTPMQSAARARSASCARGGRSSTASSRSCARSTSSTSRRSSCGATR